MCATAHRRRCIEPSLAILQQRISRVCVCEMVCHTNGVPSLRRLEVEVYFFLQWGRVYMCARLGWILLWARRVIGKMHMRLQHKFKLENMRIMVPFVLSYTCSTFFARILLLLNRHFYFVFFNLEGHV